MNFIKQTYQLNYHVNNKLIVMTLFGFTLIFTRILITQSTMYGFLVWNLFLAFVPYAIIQFVKLKVNWLENYLSRTAICLTWLLFLPNAFYVLTDFVHIKYSAAHLFWYDLILVAVFTLISFTLGILSLKEGLKLTSLFITPKTISFFFVPLICFLCGFGIYLGRFLRFNSWEIITNPIELMITVFETLVQPEALLFSMIYGMLIYFINLVKKPLF